MNVLPWPGSLSARRPPPLFSRMARVIASPRPSPRAFVEYGQPNLLGRALEFAARTKVNYPLSELRSEVDERSGLDRLEGRADVGLRSANLAAFAFPAGVRGDLIGEILHRDAYDLRRGTIVTGLDFGTGSSREHAVWALQNYGFKAVISPRFGDTFRGNAGKAGLLAAQVDEKVVQRLWDHLENEPGAVVTVDLESRIVRAGEGPDAIEDSFDIDDYTRWRLLEGLDDIDITLSHDSEIATYEKTRPTWKPATL